MLALFQACIWYFHQFHFWLLHVLFLPSIFIWIQRHNFRKVSLWKYTTQLLRFAFASKTVSGYYGVLGRFGYPRLQELLGIFRHISAYSIRPCFWVSLISVPIYIYLKHIRFQLEAQETFRFVFIISVPASVQH